MNFETEHPTSERALLEQARNVRVNGTDLAYVSVGQGEPVVFVHGGISDLTVWESLLDPTSQQYRAITYSRRYAWPNAPIADDTDDQMAPHVDDLIAFVESLSLGPVRLVGNSWGGFICLLTASKRPDLVRSMVVQEPPVMPLVLGSPPRPTKLFALLATRPALGRALFKIVAKGIAPSVKLLKRGRLQESVEVFARRVALGDAPYDRLPAHFKMHMMLNSGTHRAQFLGKGFPKFTTQQAKAISTPTLVMTGQQSPAGLRLLATRLVELLPNARRVEIPGASHVMHLDNPKATADAILSFFKDPIAAQIRVPPAARL